ncbi:hypothetical protein F0562_008542 [Nyssa sinensis]|uniref:Trehalose-phosphatase n=1 Tax=Nyssa sinensis TaxID=561372 RepID=A0A5J5A565_9ASTE|nr:hypothetical protein F0562_008542 [Nyssa sinensis]
MAYNCSNFHWFKQRDSWNLNLIHFKRRKISVEIARVLIEDSKEKSGVKMMSRSYTNLLELASGNFPVMGRERERERERRRFPRVMTVPGSIVELDDDQAHSVSSENLSSLASDRIIIVANQLPLKAKQRPDNKGWSFSWDEDSLVLQLKDGLPEDMEVLYVGSLRVDVDPIDQDDVAQLLLDKFKCVPTFLPPNILEKFYDGFCKKHLWPLFHYMLPLSADKGGQFDRSMWEARMLGLEYQSKRGYIGLEYYGRTVGIKIMPVGIHMGQIESVMKLADKEWRVGELKQKFDGKNVFLGVDDMDIFKDREYLVQESGSDLSGPKKSMLVVSEFIGCSPSLSGAIRVNPWNVEATAEAMNEAISMAEPEKQLRHEKHYRYVSTHDVAYWSRSFLQDMERTCADHFRRRCWGIGLGFGFRVVALDPNFRKLSIDAIVSDYSRAKSRAILLDYDGTVMPQNSMNRTPSAEWVMSRQSETSRDLLREVALVGDLTGEIDFCSYLKTSRVGGWSIYAKAFRSMGLANLRPSMIQKKSFFDVCRIQDWPTEPGDGGTEGRSGLGHQGRPRVYPKKQRFQQSFKAQNRNSHKAQNRNSHKAQKRGYFQGRAEAAQAARGRPSSGRPTYQADLAKRTYVSQAQEEGDRATNGDEISKAEDDAAIEEGSKEPAWPQNEEWEICGQSSEFGWMRIAKPVMQLYTEATDGSSIETKESALVWQYRDADLGFGFFQAKEMLDHLESVLANEPVAVKSGQFIVEVKPQAFSKGLVAEKIFTSMAENGKQADFVLCIGDDRSDEDMFEIIGDAMSRNILSANTSVFACTVGQKPSKAKYYLDDTTEVITMLESLSEATNSPPSSEEETDGSP